MDIGTLLKSKRKELKLSTNQKVAGSNPAGATIRTQTPQGIAVFFISRGTNVNSIRGIFGEKC